MSTAFTDSQYDMCYPLGIERHWWNLSRSARVASLLAAQARPDSTFLEVGCGRGLEVKAFRDLGYNVRGVELAQIAPLDGLEEFVTSGIDAMELPESQRQDVTGLLLLDVIEHLPEPQEFLRKLAEGFPNLEAVIIAVPASQELWSNYDEFYGHFRRYTTAMLEELGRELGWEQKSGGYFFHLIYIPMLILTWMGKDRRTSFDAPGPATRWLHKLIYHVNRLDTLLLPQWIKGASAYAVYHLKR